MANNFSPTRWLLPSLSQWLWLVLFVALLSPPWRTLMVASDGDAVMHWRVGDWMIEQRQLIRADPFSHTRHGAPIVSKEWLSELMFATAGRMGGLFGLSALAALLIATTFALLHWRLLREGNDLLMATALTVLAAWAASMHWMARPHLFSLLMLLIWHDRLRHRASVWLMAALMALWVNLHGGFIAGWLVLGVYWIGALRDRQQRRRLSLIALACGAAVLLNPNGWHLPWHNLQFLRSEFLMNWLAEYASMNFQSAEARGFLAWLAVLFATLAWCRPRLTAGESLVLVSWTAFALFSQRNIPLMVIVTAPIIAPALADALPERWRAFSARLASKKQGWPLVAVLALTSVLCMAHPMELPRERWPLAAVEHIRAHSADFNGRMFNDYVWGGYLLKALPEHRVFVDGRTDFYGEALIRDYVAISELRTNWLATLQRYDIAWTLLPRCARLNQALSELPQWRCAYRDETAIIYRRSP